MTFYLFKSDKPEKKYYVEFINPDSRRRKTIYFGMAGGEDMTMHKDENKKKAYIARHSKLNENWNDPYSGAGFWSLNLLWNEKTLPKSIKATENKYNINIINRTN